MKDPQFVGQSGFEPVPGSGWIRQDDWNTSVAVDTDTFSTVPTMAVGDGTSATETTPLG